MTLTFAIVVVAKGRIAADCKVLRAHPSPYPEQHLDRFGHFCKT